LIVYQKIKNFILDILFPISCLTCGQDDFWLCDECLRKIPILNFQVCPRCERIIVDQGKLCPNCKKYAKTVIPSTRCTSINFVEGSNEPFYLDALIVATKYSENNISKIIHLYKYNFIRDLSAPLGEILTKGLLKSNLPLPDFILPVPLHSRRLRWRGFNQAKLIAKIISQKLTPGFEIPLLDGILIRKRYTRPQMKVKNYFDRQKNIRDSFILNESALEKVKNKKVLLVDDVATTSATLSECARILKENGVKKVFAAVIARQEIRKK
jgi:ComF family protein